jgi:hypothetical protein
MISKWKNGRCEEVIEKAETIASEMRLYGLVVIRIKVESMAGNSGVPLEPNSDVTPISANIETLKI